MSVQTFDWYCIWTLLLTVVAASRDVLLSLPSCPLCGCLLQCCAAAMLCCYHAMLSCAAAMLCCLRSLFM
jgi:hypothetical protein